MLHKMQGISLPSEEFWAPQGGLCFMEVVYEGLKCYQNFHSYIPSS
jgi:hypothetical protein